MQLDFQIDTSWCPVCNRQILPKRYLVPVPPPAPVSPPPPPSPPLARKNQGSDSSTARPNKRNGTIRAKGGGLVHGTGRIKPNGTIKRSNSTQSRKVHQASAEQLPPPAPTKPSAPPKQRTIIDQGPTPLYCSDECRLADVDASFGALSLDFNPDRQSPPLPPVPRNSFASLSTSPESESESGSSADSIDPPTATSLCHAALAPIYGFPPLPPAPPLLRRPSSPEHYAANNFQSGIMMAGQRIKAVFSPEPPKRNGFAQPSHMQSSKERQPIPGWTDGSDAWRASVYSFAAPRDPNVANNPDHDDRRAYKSFVASSHRSHGVYSTLDAAYETPAATSPPTTTAYAPGLTRNRTVDELYSKYPLALSRRSDSRSSLGSISPTLMQARSLPTTVAPIVRKKEVPLLKCGAEGKLLVPDVKLKVSTSFVSVSASSSVTTESCRSSRLMRRDSEYSEFSMESVSELAEDEGTASSLGLPKPRRQPVETRSWSYDNLVTYPIMQLPRQTEKRVEKRIVDGVEKDVEVEVELPTPPLKRLFLFPGKEVR